MHKINTNINILNQAYVTDLVRVCDIGKGILGNLKYSYSNQI